MSLSTMIERYIWSVRYNDGTVHHEYPDPDTHQPFDGARAGDVVHLTLKPNPWLELTGQRYIVACDPDAGERAVVFRRVALNVQTGESSRWNVIGKQMLVNGKSVKSLMYIPDGDGPVVLGDETLEVG